MKRSLVAGTAHGVVAVLLFATASAGSLSPALQHFAESDSVDVIVIFRDQIGATPATRGWRAARSAVLDVWQGRIVSRLQNMRAGKVRKFRLINAVAANVSKAQAAELASDPEVQAVVPDVVIRQPRIAKRSFTPTAAAADSSASTLCDTLEPEALQLTNTAFGNSGIAQAQTVIDGNGKPLTGRGVKVAFIADGIDPNIEGFTRADGSKVFIDYQDFSGDPAGTPTGGAEAFGDASAIAAQDMPNGKPLRFDISAQAPPGRLPSPCNIQIRGAAPGASLIGLKIYSINGYTSASNFVRAIEYAVLNDDVDVINESFSGNPYPDNDNDPVTLASEWAVRAGVTVVTSTGDAGTAGTVGAPATSPAVIAVGGSTSFRAYAQLAGLGVVLLQNFGYLSNNISSLSSGGFAQRNARTVDVVAPGDVGWAFCSTNVALYFACGDFNGAPAPFQLFGGTSQSAPLTSGAVALVIQAYRSTHRGADPSPALVKQILMSTATDLRAPASEQGAGLINTLAAVNAALGIADELGTPKPRGTSVLNSPTSIAIVDDPDTEHAIEVGLTNNGTTAQHVVPHLQTLSKVVAGANLHVQLSPGATAGIVKRTFNVPPGAQHLDVAIAYQNDASSIALVDLQLIDPVGRIAAYSLPQGVGNGYGHVDVVAPTAGTWTAVIATPPAASPISYTGRVQFSWSVERYTEFGSIVPASVDLAPGASRLVTVRFRMPAQAGDIAAAIRFDRTNEAAARSIPITLRTLVAIDSQGGSFTGRLTGGNGRAFAGPTQSFEFNVPRGANNLNLTLDLSDSAYALQGELIDPQGLELSVQPNLDPSGSLSQYGLQLTRRDPQPGRWRFVLLQNFNSSGNQTSLPFNAQVSFARAHVSAVGMPDRATLRLPAGHPLEVPVHITNTGPTTLAYFVDARSSTLTTTTLSAQPECPYVAICSLFLVPPATTGILFVARADQPIGMDANPVTGFNIGFTGEPDIFAREVAPNTVAATLFAPEIPYGPWVEYPSFLGPFGNKGTPLDPIETAAVILYQPFDTAVSSDRGNRWSDQMSGTKTYKPLVLAPGQSGTIHVKITPDATQVGRTVTGFLYIDTFNEAAATGDEIVRIPYTYTIAP